MTEPSFLGNDVTHSGQVFPPQLMQSRKSPTGTPINQSLQSLTGFSCWVILSCATLTELSQGPSESLVPSRSLRRLVRQLSTYTHARLSFPNIPDPLGSRTLVKARCECKPHNADSARQLLAHALPQIHKRLPAGYWVSKWVNEWN